MKKARFWIGILISIIALAFAFRQVDFAACGCPGRRQLLAAGPSLVPLVLFLFLRAFRWRLLFYPKQGLHLLNLFAVINIGYLLSNIFPARLGDVARAYLSAIRRMSAVRRLFHHRRRAGAGCSVRGRGFFLVLPFAPLPDWMVRAGLIVGVAALVAVVIFVILVRRRDWTLRLLDRILRACVGPTVRP